MLGKLESPGFRTDHIKEWSSDGAWKGTFKNPTKYLWHGSLDCRSTLFLKPPAYLCGVISIYEMLLTVTLLGWVVLKILCPFNNISVILRFESWRYPISEIKVARPGFQPRTLCSTTQELNTSTLTKA